MVSENFMYKNCNYAKHEGTRQVPLESMTKDKSRPDGYGYICKKCGYLRKKSYVNRVYSGALGIQTVETFRTYSRNKKNDLKIRGGLAKSLWFSAKNRAKAIGLDFNIEQNDIIIPTHCPILGIELVQSVLIHEQIKNQKRKVGINLLPPNYPSIDRLDSTKGYTKENITVISWRANHIKSNSSFEEIEKLYDWWKIQ